MSDVANLIVEANNRAISFLRQEKYFATEQLLNQILKIDPDDLIALNTAALLACRKGNFQKSIEIFDRISAKHPNDWNSQNNLAIVYKEMENIDASIEHLNKAISLNPDFIPARVNLGIMYEIQDRYQEAKEQFHYALKFMPQDVNLLVSLSHAYACLNDIDAAIHYCNEALIEDPNFAKGHFNMGVYRGLQGNWEEAFKEMEWKWQSFKNIDLITERPIWNGQDLLDGKRILIYSEQANGDLIQFISYADYLQMRGAYVILECDENIAELFDNVDEIRIKGIRSYDFDYHASVLSLPYYFNIHPVKQKYIKPLESTLEWEKYNGLYKIGMVWAGGATHPNDRNRSFNCSLLKDICNIPGTAVFSLQKDIRVRHWKCRGEVDLCKGISGMKMIDMREHMATFSDTASIINELDLVITVDTAVAHLAGAIGKPTWLLLPFHPDWRWGLTGDKTLWYDSIKIFRQNQAGKWEDVLKTVESEIKSTIYQQATNYMA